jgi:hypothetical protein
MAAFGNPQREHLGNFNIPANTCDSPEIPPESRWLEFQHVTAAAQEGEEAVERTKSSRKGYVGLIPFEEQAAPTAPLQALGLRRALTLCLEGRMVTRGIAW